MLVLVNLAFLPTGFWPHLGFVYRLLSTLEARNAWSYEGTLGRAIPVMLSSGVTILDLTAAWWFARRPRGVRAWEGPVYAGCSKLMAGVHLLVAAFLIFLWWNND